MAHDDDLILTYLKEIKEQTTKTNGRLTQVEGEVRELKTTVEDLQDVIYGDEERHTSGLLLQSYEVGALLRRWNSMERMGRWLLGVLGAIFLSTIPLFINGLMRLF